VVIRESTSPFLELELSGTVAELRRIAEALSNMNAGQSFEIPTDPKAIASPYQRCLNRLEVDAAGGPVRVAIIDDTLKVSGSPEMLHTFASYFRFADDAESGLHSHHEWFEGDKWIAPDSRPLVVSVS
jgi:hypothetical protein